MLLVCVLLIIARLAAAQTCTDGCTDCKVEEPVCLTKLGADEIRVDGCLVPPGDNNPCTTADYVTVGGVPTLITVHTKNCCHTKSDCDQFLPSTCHMVEDCNVDDFAAYQQSLPCRTLCITASIRCIGGCDPADDACKEACDDAANTCIDTCGADASFGWCQFSKIVGCCADDGDCPNSPLCTKRVCDTNGCNAESNPLSLFFTERDDASGHRNVWSKRNVNFEPACGRCVNAPAAEQPENCCVTSSDCNGPDAACVDDEQGFCDGAHTCVCVPGRSFECTVATQDADCAPLLARCPDACAVAICEDGRCHISQDPDNTFHYCAVDDETTNADDDAFLKCGTVVTRVCGDCPFGQKQYDEADVTSGAIHCELDSTSTQVPQPTVCTLACMCDVCDDAADDETPDRQFCCATDIDGDTHEECEPGPQTVCLAREAEATSPEGIAAENEAACQTIDNTNSPVTPGVCTETIPHCWHATGSQFCTFDDEADRKRQQTGPVCDECPGSLAVKPTTCLLDCDRDGQPLCNPSAVGQSVADCCADLTSEDQRFISSGVKACCLAILAVEGGYPADGDARVDFPAVCTSTTTPVLPLQCDCPAQGYVDIKLADSLHQDLCECVNAGVDVVPEAGEASAHISSYDYIATCSVDSDHDRSPSCVTIELCVPRNPNDISVGIEAACGDRNLVVPAATPDDCDACEDNPATTHQFGCFADLDQDSFVDCTSCTSVCFASDCPANTHAIPATSPAPSARGKVTNPVRPAAAVVVPAKSGAHAAHKRQAPPTTEYIVCPTAGNPPPAELFCDCCDTDSYAFPGSRFGSTRPIGCLIGNQLSWDYNCNGHNDTVVVCEDTDGSADDIFGPFPGPGGRYIRGLEPTGATSGLPNSSPTLSDGVYTGLEPGECNLVVDECQMTHGVCLEDDRKRSIGAMLGAVGKKRAAGDGSIQIPAPVECTGQVLQDPESPTLGAGSCVEYLDACHKKTHDTGPMCHCDCDVCVLVIQ